MRELGETLVDIHSQHQNLLLQKEDFQLNVIDIIGMTEQELNEYKKEFNKYHELVKETEDTRAQIEENKRNEDFCVFN